MLRHADGEYVRYLAVELNYYVTVILARQESRSDRIVQKSTLFMCFNITSTDLKMQIYYTAIENHPVSIIVSMIVIVIVIVSVSVNADLKSLFDACSALL